MTKSQAVVQWAASPLREVYKSPSCLLCLAVWGVERHATPCLYTHECAREHFGTCGGDMASQAVRSVHGECEERLNELEPA
jgi:hypothetical protein